MAVLIGSARIDERGKISGGAAGDSTGKEVSTQDWYKHPKIWEVIRAKDSNIREKIAVAMAAACANNNIGYDQGQRNTLYDAAKSVGFDPAKVTFKVETDCSGLVRVCVSYAGITVGDFNTSSEKKVLLNTGKFDVLNDSKYSDSPDYLLRGDILVTKTKGHTVVVLSNGSKATASAASQTTTSSTNTTSVSYYPKYAGSSSKIDDVFRTIGAPYGNVSKRKPVAIANGISNYSGTAIQNNNLVSLAKKGKLKK